MSTPPDDLPITARLRLDDGASRGAIMPTLAELKDMLGIAGLDATQDAAILSQFETTLAVVENYLGRGVAFGSVVQAFEPVETRNRRLMLHRFPVALVRSVTVDGVAVTGYRLFPASGILQFREDCGGGGHMRGGCANEPIVLVDYDGGYLDDAWPADLMDALMRAFFSRWNATGATGSSAEITSQAPIRSVTVDGSSVTWGDFQASAEKHGGGPVPNELLAVSAQLDPYRARLVTGV